MGEQHFDDCGDDLLSIVELKQPQHLGMLMDSACETEREPDEGPEAENSGVHVSLQASLLGSDAVQDQRAQRQRTYEAVDSAEFTSLLAEKQPHWGTDVLELC